MYNTLISFATYWGSKYGGINAFNTDFLGRFGKDFKDKVQVICLVSSAEDQDFEKAKEENVILVKLPYPPKDKAFLKDQTQSAIDALKTEGIEYNPETTIWLGHDRISGEAATEAAKKAGGRSALIHHMSYETYEGFAEDSQSAYEKTQNQKLLFEQADLLLAVGPFLHKALADLLDKSQEDIHCLIPGLAEIEPRKTPPNKLRAFLSGRLSDDAKKIKQGHLGMAGFARAIKNAYEHNSPKLLIDQPQMTLRGVDFESRQNYGSNANTNTENEWNKFVEQYSGRRITLNLLPYTQDRQRLYDDLKQSSIALMPSWHEGFGLVAWEAIAAGVPLIISRNSGVYRLLEDEYQDGLVTAIDIEGKTGEPFFSDNDLTTIARAIKNIANDLEGARNRAIELRSRLAKYTWSACAANAAKYFGWDFPSNPSDLPQPFSETSILTPAYPIADISGTSPDSQLVMPSKYWQQGLPESRLLWADEAVVPFESGPSEFLATLHAWLDDPKWPQAIRLVTGAGGTGKTRLSLELCLQRIQAGWYCGFWSTQEAANPTALWRSLLSINQPSLIVIDYAETRQPSVLALVKTILQNPGTQPVRILLLARTGGEWWDNLPSKDRDCELFLSSYATSGPYALPLLYVEADKRFAAYQRAVAAYAQALGLPTPEVQPDLSGEHFAKPLYLQMAALLALLGEHPATAEGLTNALLHHERRYWAKVLAHLNLPEPEKLAQHLLGLATLAGSFATARDALPYWENASDALLTPTQFSQLFNALTPLYPGKQGLQAVQPDLLGEALVSQVLAQPSGHVLLETVLREPSLQYSSLTVIARLYSHRPNLKELLLATLIRHFVSCCKFILKVALEAPGSLTSLACEAFAQLQEKDKSQAAGLLKLLLKDESVELAQLDYAVRKFEVDKTYKKLDKVGNKAKDSLRLEHANNLNNLSIAIYRIGGLEKLALKQAEQAVAICQLVRCNKTVDFYSIYAVCLGTYSNRLSDLGESNKAVSIETQVLEICKLLMTENPDRFEPRYALSLNNYAYRLGEIGNTNAALATVEQALEIYERLMTENPDRFEPHYAASLITYANQLSRVGNANAALATAEQALEICKRLATKNPDRFEPRYALSLNNYAYRLGEIGNTNAALATAEQALEIYERLATKNPDRFEAQKFLNICNVLFTSWLAELNTIHPVPLEMPSLIAEHEKPEMGFYLAITQGYLGTDHQQRSEAFSSAYSFWQSLSIAQKNADRGHCFCVYGWLRQYQSKLVLDDELAMCWQTFKQKRNGSLPHWMQTVAERLKFTWPD